MNKKILVSNRAGIGDVILTTPILKALREKYPDSKLVFMVGPNCLDVVRGLDFIDEIITYDKKVDSMGKVIKKIWRFDMALCLDFKYRTPVMAFLAGISIRGGLKHKRKLFLSHPVEKRLDWEQTYESNNYANVIRESVGIELPDDLTQLYLPQTTDADQAYVKDLLFAHGIKEQPFICISPFTSWGPKDWPAQHYVELIKKLVDSTAYPIVLIGTEGDAEKSGELLGLPSAANIMGKTSLMQMAEVIKQSNLMVGGCSAPLHMAAAAHVPIVGLYGATSPERWAPRNNCIAHYKKFACSPCNGPMIGCAEKACMTSITVDEVFASCSKLLEFAGGKA